MRIVSLEPSVTGTLHALGAMEHVVAVTRYCSRVVDIGDRPQLETTWSADAQAIAALEPDLVIAATPYRAGKIDELLQAGLDVVCLYPRTLADIERHITLLGRITGTADAAASITAALRAELAMAPVAAGQRVYVEMWPNPLRTAETWVKEIVEALGADFVPAEPNVQITGEQIIDAAPDVIVLAWAGVAEIDPDPVYARPGWQQIPAVRDGRVLPVNEIMLNAPGPNLVEGIRELRQVLRGE